MSTMSDSIERGMTRAVVLWRDGEIKTRELASVAINLIMQEPLLTDEVMAVLADRFRLRLKTDVLTLAASVSRGATHAPPRSFPDLIGEWTEELERISMAVYYFEDEDDVHEALRFIHMSGSDWSDYIHQAEADNDD